MSDSVRLITQMEKEIERLNHKFSSLDSSDKHKKKEIDEMNGRLARIETTILDDGDSFKSQNHHNRPGRSISLSTIPPCNGNVKCAFDFKDNGHDEAISKPPTSCIDLQKSGHVLNGYYPIKITEEKKIALVFCNFKFNGNLSSSSKGS